MVVTTTSGEINVMEDKLVVAVAEYLGLYDFTNRHDVTKKTAGLETN